MTKKSKKPKIGALEVIVMPSELHAKDPRLEKLDPALPKTPNNMLILGRVGEGKTSFLYSALCNWYIDQKGVSVFDEIILYSGSTDSDSVFLADIPCPNLMVFHEFEPESFKSYLKKLKKHQRKLLDEGKPKLNILIAFDDFIARGLIGSSGKGGELERLIFTSRHEANTTVIFCSQALKSNGFSTPNVRNNIRYYICYDLAENDIDKLAEEHAGLYTKNEFKELFFAIHADPYKFLMIDYADDTRERRYRYGLYQKLPPPARQAQVLALSQQLLTGKIEPGELLGEKIAEDPK